MTIARYNVQYNRVAVCRFRSRCLRIRSAVSQVLGFWQLSTCWLIGTRKNEGTAYDEYIAQ